MKISHRTLAPGTPRALLYAAAFVVASLLGAGLGLAIDMSPGDGTNFDRGVAARVDAVRPDHPGVTSYALFVTRLGNLEVTGTVLTVIVLGLAFARWRGSSRVEADEAPFWLIVAIGGQLMNWGLKLLYRRDRPPSEGRLVEADFYSFPSGHGTFAGVSLVLFAAVMIRAWGEHARGRVAIGIALMAGLALSVAASRVWLGVHYATDVIVGFLVGLTWAGLCHAIRFGLPRLDASDPSPLR